MPEIIQLLAAENSANRKKNPSRQRLFFLILAANLDYNKQIDVVWRGQTGDWRTLPARFLAEKGDGQEYWQAEITLHAGGEQPLPGDISFALRYRITGQEFWDNNHGLNHAALLHAGLELGGDTPIHNLSLSNRLMNGQKSAHVKIAVNANLAAEQTFIHWTTDNWRTTHHANCRLNRQTERHKTQIWQAYLKIGDAFRLQYAIGCKHGARRYWDDNAGKNYVVSREPLKIMILNLHCYQEERQDQKFSQIAKAIDELAVDIVCFQEVAEHWNHGHGDWASNSANIINQRLDKPFHLFSDWSHLGFDKYREGVAILSRYPFRGQESRYVSDSHDVYSIHSRKVVMTKLDIPYLGGMNVFSAHLSWWEDGFQRQFQRLGEWANQTGREVGTTLLCGDFNITAGGRGYWQVVGGHEYEDQYLAANNRGLFEKVFRVDDNHWRDYPADDYRIDYIFKNKDSNLRVTSARTLFTEADYGRVSDHCGYLMTFEPK